MKAKHCPGSTPLSSSFSQGTSFLSHRVLITDYNYTWGAGNDDLISLSLSHTHYRKPHEYLFCSLLNPQHLTQFLVLSRQSEKTIFGLW